MPGSLGVRWVVLSFALWSASAVAQPLCNSGSGCSCAPLACTCTDGCDFECRGGVCDFTSPGDGQAQCQAGSTCTATFGGDGALSCEDGATCRLTTTGGGFGSCNNQANCQLEVGPNTNFLCKPELGFACVVSCAPPCVVTCTGAGTCTVACTSGAMTNCGGGVVVCGACPPRDGGIDAGLTDAGAPDAGGSAVDAGAPDAGGSADASVGDAGAADAGDAGQLDAGEVEGRDGGAPARHLTVGSGCAEAGTPLTLAGLALALLIRKTRPGRSPSA